MGDVSLGVYPPPPPGPPPQARVPAPVILRNVPTFNPQCDHYIYDEGGGANIFWDNVYEVHLHKLIREATHKSF